MTRAAGGRSLGPTLAAFAGGVLAASAHPPIGFVPGLFGYALLLLALESPSPRPWRSAVLRGWAGGAGYIGASTPWIVEPFMVDAAAHAWQAPFAVVGMAGGVGLLWGLGAGLHRALAPRRGPGRVLAFAAAFAAAEWLRGHLFTGFPWNLPGETFRAGVALSQGVALFGAYGFSFVVLLAGAAPAALSRRIGGGAERLLAPACAVVLVGAVGLWGEARLAAAPAPASALRVRAVQPDLPEPPAWTPALLAAALDRYTALTAAPPPGAARAPDLVVWPEGALPTSLNQALDPAGDVAAPIAASLRPGQTLVLGGARAEAPVAGARWFNTLAAVRGGPGGLAVEGVYDKHHLVPFGEYLPLAPVLGGLGLRKLISVAADFSPGPPPRPLDLPGVGRVQPLICYEALFPGLARGGGGVRPSLLLNISDDAWFGRDIGPWQHFNLASHRAIEEGLPMVRATPTGVSGVIDAYGRPLGLLAPGRRGVVDAPLPPPAPPTPYARWREGPLALILLAAAAAKLMSSVRHSRNDKDRAGRYAVARTSEGPP